MEHVALSPEPPHHEFTALGLKYKNPWPSAAFPSVSKLFSGGWLGLPDYALREAALKGTGVQDVKVVRPDWGRRRLKEMRRAAPPSDTADFLVATWLGHAGAFVEIPLSPPVGVASSSSSRPPTLKCLFDPIFSQRAGPIKRMRESPCTVEDLPGVHVVFISHNHYDHLDLATIQAVVRLYPRTLYCVPLGNKAWFISLGIHPAHIFELDWWDEIDLPASFFTRPSRYDASSSGEEEEEEEKPRGREERVRVTCLPAQHTSGRGVCDQRATLCDTGYRPFQDSPDVCPAFARLGRHFGPLDLAFLPIWRGGTLGFVSSMSLRLRHENLPCATHGSPGDAVAIHLDVKSRNTIGVHFGTFEGSNLEALEALTDLEAARKKAGVRSLRNEKQGKRGRLGWLNLGESFVVRVVEQYVPQ
ncbi:hypothetical protein JCM6882_004323 [Rhodosporidiobolus microsporus]